MNNLFTVMSFEFNGFIRKKSNWIYIILVAILSIFIAISPFIINLFDDDSPSLIYLYNENVDINPLETFFNDEVYVFNDKDELNEMVENGDVENFYYLGKDKITFYTTGSIGINSQSKISSFKSIIREIYITKFMTDNGLYKQYNEINNYINNIDMKKFQISNNQFSVVNPENNSELEQSIRFAVGYFLLMLAYMTIMQYGSYVSTTVGKEKSSRTMESLIYSTNTNSLILGKVLGVFLGAIVQILIMCIMLITAIFIALRIAIYTDTFTSQDIQMIAKAIFSIVDIKYILVFLTLYSFGFLINLFLFASLSATISNIEEIASAISVGTILSLIIFMISIMIFLNPGNKFLMSLSYFPLFTPLTMFARYSLGLTSTCDMIYAYIVSPITILLIGIFASKLYRVGVLLYGTKPSFRTLVVKVFSKNN